MTTIYTQSATSSAESSLVYVFEVGNKETGDGRSGGETGMDRCSRAGIEPAQTRRRRLRCRLGGGAASPPRRLIPAYGDAPAKNRTWARGLGNAVAVRTSSVLAAWFGNVSFGLASTAVVLADNSTGSASPGIALLGGVGRRPPGSAPGIPAYPRPVPKRQDRPVTPEVAGSSPVARVLEVPANAPSGGSVIRRVKNHAGGRARQLPSARRLAGCWAAEGQQTCPDTGQYWRPGYATPSSTSRDAT